MGQLIDFIENAKVNLSLGNVSYLWDRGMHQQLASGAQKNIKSLNTKQLGQDFFSLTSLKRAYHLHFLKLTRPS